MALQLQTAPASEPLTVAETKTHLRVDTAADDTLIGNLITVAREWCEEYRNQSFINQTWDLFMDGWPGGDLLLRRGPVSSVTSIVYFDEDDNESTFASSNYVTDLVSEPARVRLKSGASWPSTTLRRLNGVRVRYVAGYGAAPSAVPESVRSAMLLLIGDLYENREDTVLIPGVMPKNGRVSFGVRALLRMNRVKEF